MEFVDLVRLRKTSGLAEHGMVALLGLAGCCANMSDTTVDLEIHVVAVEGFPIEANQLSRLCKYNELVR